jgi:DNA-directed RNA polymerase specialized sigma24 family protein
VSGEHGEVCLAIEEWEMELAKRIAGAFRSTDEELAAELLLRLAELKATARTDIRDWRAFLVRSLYNAAKNSIRRDDVRRGRHRSLDFMSRNDETTSLLEQLPAPPEPVPMHIGFADIRKELTYEMRELTDLLIENEGSISAVAKALDRPRKTVEYWITKLRRFLRTRGIEP